MASVQDRWFTEREGANGQTVKVPTSRHGQGLRWRAHYRTPDGKQRGRSFARKADAENFLTTTEASKLVGNYIDPSLARLTVGVWAERWLEGQAHLKPSTLERYSGIVREHVLPAWTSVKLADVSNSAVQAWVTTIAATRKPATVHKAHRVLSLILASAVKDGRLVRNPADGVNLPRVVAGERRYLTHDQVEQLANACAVPPADRSKHVSKDWHAEYRLVVLFLAYTGVRFGEMAALRIGRVDFLRRRALIAESVTVVKGVHTWGTPKGHDRREVPIPRFLVELLTEHVRGAEQDDLVFTGPRGGPLRAQVFQRAVLTAAAKQIGVPGLHPHELRHTAASLAIASGANVKVVQQMLGHKSATMTLDLYGHLFPDQLDGVADAMDAARASGVAPVLPDAVVIDLASARRKAQGQ